MPPTRLLACLVALCLLAACGDDGDDGDDPVVAGGAPYGDVAVEGEVGEEADIDVPGDLEPAEELVTVDLVEGEGDEVPPGATVTIHYRGVLLDGTEFDASFGGEPVTFPLAGLIEGWQEGIPGMREGGRRLLVIPPELGYGAAGGGPIPPDATLLFVVDVLEVVG